MIIKRLFDFFLALYALLLVGTIIVILIVGASIDTKSVGLFTQKRIGKFGKPFTIFKIKTLNDRTKTISLWGAFLRKSKLDELPQLFNILNGTMSFVGPRPDISGYADKLEGTDRIIVTVRPGVTGLASLKYRNEEQTLALQQNPLQYNDTIIWPDKVRINKWYAENRNIRMDLVIMMHTFIPIKFDVDNFIKDQWPT
ncbi:sugar transferase [Flavobacterium tegetincola]|uniref:sugar transferase n=1 Tax=Flavobacterium tegetincola TaxID=150172 RepID=UPI00146A3C87|nr:sugar transferase [Flavobacterium tegetincola]